MDGGLDLDWSNDDLLILFMNISDGDSDVLDTTGNMIGADDVDSGLTVLVDGSRSIREGDTKVVEDRTQGLGDLGTSVEGADFGICGVSSTRWLSGSFPVDGNSPEADDDAGDGTFVIDGAPFSSVGKEG